MLSSTYWSGPHLGATRLPGFARQVRVTWAFIIFTYNSKKIKKIKTKQKGNDNLTRESLPSTPDINREPAVTGSHSRYIPTAHRATGKPDKRVADPEASTCRVALRLWDPRWVTQSWPGMWNL